MIFKHLIYYLTRGTFADIFVWKVRKRETELDEEVLCDAISQTFQRPDL